MVSFSMGLSGGRHGDAAQHPGEYQGVDGVQPVPVEDAREAYWIEDRGLSDCGSIPVFLHLELEPGPSG